MFCFKCGKELVDGAMFCAFCGTNVQALYEKNKSSDDKSDEKNTLTSATFHDNDESRETDEIVEAKIEGLNETYNISERCEKVNLGDVENCEGNTYEHDTEEGEDDEEEEYALEDFPKNGVELYENATSDDLAKIYSYNDKYVIPLGGGRVVYPEEMMAVILINRRFNVLSLEAANTMSEFYQNAGDIETVIKGGNDLALEILENAADNTLKLLGLIDIFDYTVATVLQYSGEVSQFRLHNSSPIDIWNEAADVVGEAYNAIIEKADNEKLRREIRKEGRSRMSGMGFGLSGAIEAQLKAGAYNMATGAAHSIFNAVGNAMTDSTKNKNISSLYGSDETRKVLVFGIYNAVQQIKFDTITLYGMEMLYNRKGIKKAETILANIYKGTVPEQKINSVIIELLHLDPFNEDLYKLCIQRFGDNNYEISLLARFFEMETGVRNIKKDILIDYIHRTVCITNKKAIIRFINDEENDTWTESIIDKDELSNDIEFLKEIFDNLNISNPFVIRTLELVSKNLTNKEGALTNDILAEMVFLNYKLSDISEAYEYSEELDIEDLATIYCLDIKKIDDKCFEGFNIDKTSVLEFKKNLLILNIENRDVITNKKAIVELVDVPQNVDWVKLISDKSKINSDIKSLEKLYDDLCLNISRDFVMGSLRLVEKNISNKEGVLTNDILAEMIFLSNKLKDINESYNYPLKDLDIEGLANKYCLDIKRIDAQCFDKFDIDQTTICKLKENILLSNVNNSTTIENKKAIIELISNGQNVDWGKLITDKYHIKRDVQVLDSLYDKLDVDTNKDFVLTALRLIEKNIANKEGILTNEILSEMIFVYHKFSHGLTSVEQVKGIPIKKLELACITDKYFFKTKIIAENCFAGFKIDEIKFKNIGIERLDKGAFRNSNIKRIDALKVKVVPAYAFEGCTKLEKVDFFRNTLALEEGVFNGCENLKLVVLPKSVTKVAEFISDNHDICYECYDCNVESYKICTGYGWKVKISQGAEEFEKGKEYDLQRKYSEAFQHFKEASDKHYIYAYEYLAKCYYNALGTEQNYSEALKYFYKASENTGNPVCKHTIGFMHQNGQGTPVDIYKALNCYAEAGKAGVAWSMNAIAMIFYQGLGGNMDLAEAAKWFTKAANAGDQTAKNNMQQLLSQNPGIVPVPDNGMADFDIKYLARKNPSLITKLLFDKFDTQKGDGIYFCNMTEKAIKKFSKATKAYVSLRRGEMPIVCFDNTIFGGAEDGCVLTNYGMYIHNDGEEKQQVFYSQILNISKGEKKIELQTESGNLFIVVEYFDETLDKLSNIIQQCLEYFKS